MDGHRQRGQRIYEPGQPSSEAYGNLSKPERAGKLRIDLMIYRGYVEFDWSNRMSLASLSAVDSKHNAVTVLYGQTMNYRCGSMHLESSLEATITAARRVFFG